MNFPGLDPAWTGWHRLLQRTGALAPWDLPRCRRAVAEEGVGVVVVASTALGDSLLCTPLLQTLHDRLGRERVHFLVRAPYLELYRDDPRLAQAVGVRGKFRGLGAVKDALTGAAVPPKIALVANCTEPDLIPWLWHCGVRGFLRYRTRWSRWADWFANQDMLRQPGQPDYATGHAIENNLAMADALGLEPSLHTLSLKLSREEAVAAVDLTNGNPQGPLILVHPGASREIKRWAVGNWVKVIAALSGEFQGRFVLTGSGGERDLCDRIATGAQARGVTGIQNLAGYLNLTGLAALQQRAALFLSGDTGPYHLAVAVGCPTVTLFAPTDRGSSTEACGPHRANPARHRALQTSSFDATIEEIEPATVLAEAREVLGSPNAQ